MTAPERPASDGPGLPEHERQAWDAIVADLRGQLDLGPAFTPAESPHDELVDLDDAVDLHDGLDLDDEDDIGEEHAGFVPPEPPPLPRPPDATARMAWAATAGGPILAIAANLLHWGDWLVTAGIVLTIGGFAALMARRADHRDDDGDGAVL